jgi:hypothetical protein
LALEDAPATRPVLSCGFNSARSSRPSSKLWRVRTNRMFCSEPTYSIGIEWCSTGPGWSWRSDGRWPMSPGDRHVSASGLGYHRQPLVFRATRRPANAAADVPTPSADSA